jgi:hypothetical protein
MRLIKATAATAAIVGGLIAGAVALDATANADPPPPLPAEASSDPPPAWAPAQPPQPVWAPGHPVVWDQGWGRWGIWINGSFLTLS